MGADINVVTVGTVGATGPGSVAVGSVITTRGALAVGNTVGTPISLAVGAAATYLRSNGSDPLYSALLAADMPAAIDAVKIGGGLVTNTEFGYLDGVTSGIQTQLGTKAATAHVHLLNTERGIFSESDSASAATPSDNTASTTVFAVAMQHTTVLPAGTWRCIALGGAAFAHSAAGTIVYRVSINGADSGARTRDATSATLYATGVDNDEATGLSGTIQTYIHFRSSTAGTTYAKNPWMMLIWERSA